MTESPAPGRPLHSIGVAVEGTLVVITLSGEIGIDAEGELQSAYRSAPGARRVRFHFSTGTLINSAGIAVLITLTSQARTARQTVEVSGLSPHYRKIFDMIGLTEYVNMVEE